MNNDIYVLLAYLRSQNILPMLLKSEHLRDLSMDEIRELLKDDSNPFEGFYPDGYGGFYREEEQAYKQIRRTEANLKSVESILNSYKTGEPIKFYTLADE